ncbi:unnamed protein product [Moneuplotes crassus]|uniref:Uncharacterized protein n=1 Tax=Euplotes crassus TaxID=5936 RepID=A0AAD1UFW2_EUPCR|nr:unnamed protein product [Moneuplotes crassus]
MHRFNKGTTSEEYENFIKNSKLSGSNSERSLSSYSSHKNFKNITKSKYNEAPARRRSYNTIVDDCFSDNSMGVKKRIEMGARVKAMAKFRKQNYADLSFTFKSIELPSIPDANPSYSIEEGKKKKNRKLASQGTDDSDDMCCFQLPKESMVEVQQPCAKLSKNIQSEIAKVRSLRSSGSYKKLIKAQNKEDSNFKTIKSGFTANPKRCKTEIEDLKNSVVNGAVKSKFYSSSTIKLPDIKQMSSSKCLKEISSKPRRKKMRRVASTLEIKSITLGTGSDTMGGLLNIMGKCDSLLGDISD